MYHPIRGAQGMNGRFAVKCRGPQQACLLGWKPVFPQPVKAPEKTRNVEPENNHF